MPEGDTVWRTALHLDQALSGTVLRGTDFRVPAHATLDLAGQPVVATLARGKHLLTRIGDDLTLHTHLKMEGSWHLYRPGSPWRRPAHEARVVLRTEEWTAVGFALGVVEVVPRNDEDTVVGHLGPDLLGPDWDEDEAAAAAARRPHRPVADAILDQRNLAGLGNLYKNELCFLAGVHPRLPVGEVPDLPAWYAAPGRCWTPTRSASSRPSPGTCAAASRPGSTAATSSPAGAAAPDPGRPAGARGAASGRRTGARAASRNRPADRRRRLRPRRRRRRRSADPRCPGCAARCCRG